MLSFVLSTAFARDYVFDYQQVYGYCRDRNPDEITQKRDRAEWTAQECEQYCNYGNKCTAYHTKPHCVHYMHDSERIVQSGITTETDFCYIKKYKLAGPGRCVKTDGSTPTRVAVDANGSEAYCAQSCSERADCGGYNFADASIPQELRCSLWIHNPADLREGGSGETYGVGDSICKVKYLFDNNYSTEQARQCTRTDCGENAAKGEGLWPNCRCTCFPGFFGEKCTEELLYITSIMRGVGIKPGMTAKSYVKSLGLPESVIDDVCFTEHGDSPYWITDDDLVDPNQCKDDGGEAGDDNWEESSELSEDEKHDCEIYDAICDGLFTGGAMLTQQAACSGSEFKVLELCTAASYYAMAGGPVWYIGAQITCNAVGNFVWNHYCNKFINEFGRIGYATCTEKIFGCEANNPVQIFECESLFQQLGRTNMNRHHPDFWDECEAALATIQLATEIIPGPGADRRLEFVSDVTLRRQDADASLEAPVDDEGDASLEAPVDDEGDAPVDDEGDDSSRETFFVMKYELRVESSKAADITAKIESDAFPAILAAQIEQDQDLPAGTVSLFVDPPVAAGDQCSAKDCSWNGTPSGKVPDCSCSCDAGWSGDKCSECTNQMWSQCAGLLPSGEPFEGGSCCPAGASCFVEHPWYSQCLTACPDDWDCATGLAPPAPPVVADGDDSCPNGEWEQCGGVDFAGQACCKAGLNCVETSGEWFSQCQPA